jgi:exonuclease VII small subunit
VTLEETVVRLEDAVVSFEGSGAAQEHDGVTLEESVVNLEESGVSLEESCLSFRSRERAVEASIIPLTSAGPRLLAVSFSMRSVPPTLRRP